MPLLKTIISEGSVDLVMGTAEGDDTLSVGMIDGVDPAQDHVYMKVASQADEGDRLGDVQLEALKVARAIIGAEITRLTQLQNAH